MNAEQIAERIRAALPGAQVVVRGDDGRHFEAEVVWEGFAGLSMVEQHRRVYAALGDLVGGAVHALSLRTRAQ